jgi:dihydropyrimidine dehydrogenase (NAD+) subunit PreA
MADIRNNFVGIKSPNPFWLALRRRRQAYNVERAFKAWGGVVEDAGLEGPPVVNVNGPRYGRSGAPTAGCSA